MTRYGVFALLAALCVSEPALAQNTKITGTVRNADGGAPVFGATIEITGGAATRGLTVYIGLCFVAIFRLSCPHKRP